VFPEGKKQQPFLKYLKDILRGCFQRSSPTFGEGEGKRCLKKSRIEGFVFRFGK
jgi:hypothetical protein